MDMIFLTYIRGRGFVQNLDGSLLSFDGVYHAACDSPTVLQVPLLSVGYRLLPLFNMLKVFNIYLIN